MSKLDQATKQQVAIFECNRSTAELALATIQSDGYKQDFDQFIRYVLDTVQYLTLEYSYGECQFNLNWRDYKGLFPYDFPDCNNNVANTLVCDWIEKIILAQANSILCFADVSISLDGMTWRDNLLSFVISEVIE